MFFTSNSLEYIVIYIFIAEDEGLEPPRRFKRPTLFKSAAISPTWLNPPYFNTKS